MKNIKMWAFFLAIACYVQGATVSNPIIWADVPDPSMLRVDDTYYMVSTTMHYAPGVPIMASTDLANWRTINYAYSTLTNSNAMNLNAGASAYGKGSWASSLRYNKGTYYILTPSYTTNKTHLYQTTDIKNGPWKETLFNFYHDPSLFFDDDGKVYIIYGGGEFKIIELNSDLSGVKQGGVNQTLKIPLDATTGTSSYIVKMEGAHMEKVNGKYYLFAITWPSGNGRTELVFRSSSITGNYEGKIALQNNGVAQGSIFDTPDGKWYAVLFRDNGAVGRIPYLIPVTWSNDWPVFGNAAPATLELPNPVYPGFNMVTSDDFDEETLPLEWQWNHNPDNANWSLKAKPGSMRITTSRVDSRLYYAKNTLTQRSFGPKCSGRIAVDVSGMKDGDVAGLVALQDSLAFVGVAKSGSSLSVVQYQGTSQKASVPISQNKVYFRIDMDFTNQTDKAYFFYSLDSLNWKTIGGTLSMRYTLGMFVGYRFGLFNYATKSAGGYVDFDWFKIGATVDQEIKLPPLVFEEIPQEPYKGVLSIPGAIEAENYDLGGHNNAYSDNDYDNQGGEYREDGVDVVTNDNGYAVGYTEAGEWLEYTVNVEAEDVYTVEARVASGSETSSFRLFIDDEAITDTIKVETTGDWDTYSVITAKTSKLKKGSQILKIAVTGSYVNIDHIKFSQGTIGISKPLHLNTNRGMQEYSVYHFNGALLGTYKAS
ncbi:MAG TPA: family 43 glycosylhydrolase, partial [Fibrobacteraceae bacterium]|nr:family 43 glycosylhydrolase [Fibrobacteraceae bacterium]